MGSQSNELLRYAEGVACGCSFSAVFLLGREFRIRTDHSALTWLKHTPEPIGQQARWLEIMEEFSFTIQHRPGSEHANADALSRRPCSVRDCLCVDSQ